MATTLTSMSFAPKLSEVTVEAGDRAAPDRADGDGE